MVKTINPNATKGDQFGSLASASDSAQLSSGSTSPREYAVPSVETTTSLAANPPTRAMLVRQSNPAQCDTDSSAVPIRPATEYLNVDSAFW